MSWVDGRFRAHAALPRRLSVVYRVRFHLRFPVLLETTPPGTREKSGRCLFLRSLFVVVVRSFSFVLQAFVVCSRLFGGGRRKQLILDGLFHTL